MYLARVVEAVAPEFGKAVRVETVVLKTRDGARRFRALREELGRFPPVPSLFLDGQLAFPSTPSLEELRARLAREIAQQP
ncbi:MAG: hypothetical protein HY900_30115 [Deltaproteobacteria bacterium]|nr:hypothetical protein [Deltaproteobacteria bacterium]